MISKVTLFISILILILFTFKVATHPASDNDRSRLAGIISIVRHHELNIGRTEQKITGDRIEWSGGVYSSKPPVLHVALGVFTSLAFSIKPVLIENDVAIYRIATFLTTALPLSLIFILFAKMTNRYASLLLVFGTLLVSYSQYLNNHISEALLQVLLFYLLLKKLTLQQRAFYLVCL